VNEVELLKARVEELVVERNALRESISQPATGDVRLSYEELHANYLVLIDRFKKEMKQAERANYELTKRVAELEVDVLKSDAEAVMWRERALNMTNKHSALIDLKSANDERLCKEAALLRQQVGDLQSQLAWSPVNEGLPTEPGWYVFDSGDTAPELLNLNPQHWHDTKGWNDNFQGVNPDAPAWGYVRFRRIELQKDGEI
jgi:hypothetical protein